MYLKLAEQTSQLIEFTDGGPERDTVTKRADYAKAGIPEY